MRDRRWEWEQDYSNVERPQSDSPHHVSVDKSHRQEGRPSHSCHDRYRKRPHQFHESYDRHDMVQPQESRRRSRHESFGVRCQRDHNLPQQTSGSSREGDSGSEHVNFDTVVWRSMPNVDHVQRPQKTTNSQDERVVSMLIELYPMLLPKLIRERVFMAHNRVEPYDQPLLMERCLRDIRNLFPINPVYEVQEPSSSTVAPSFVAPRGSPTLPLAHIPSTTRATATPCSLQMVSQPMLIVDVAAASSSSMAKASTSPPRRVYEITVEEAEKRPIKCRQDSDKGTSYPRCEELSRREQHAGQKVKPNQMPNRWDELSRHHRDITMSDVQCKTPNSTKSSKNKGAPNRSYSPEMRSMKSRQASDKKTSYPRYQDLTRREEHAWQKANLNQMPNKWDEPSRHHQDRTISEIQRETPKNAKSSKNMQDNKGTPKRSYSPENSKKPQPKRKRRPCCPIKTCRTEQSHMRRHVLQEHMPAGFGGINMEHGQRMASLEDFLKVAKEQLKCRDYGELLNKVIRDHIYPDTRGMTIADFPQDRQMMQDFHEWRRPNSICRTPTIDPPNVLESLLHWRVAACLMNVIGEEHFPVPKPNV